MPRKRSATLLEIRSALAEITSALQDALLAKGARKSIRRRLHQLEQEHAEWTNRLYLIEKYSPTEIMKLVEKDRRRHRKQAAELVGSQITVEQLAAMTRYFGSVADTIAGRNIEATDFADLVPKLISLATPRPFQPKRFLPKYQEAFRRRKEAEVHGRCIPVKELCQELAWYEYKRNPESCIRSMQRGIRRVEAEHARCLDHGIASPFMDEHRNDT